MNLEGDVVQIGSFGLVCVLSGVNPGVFYWAGSHHRVFTPAEDRLFGLESVWKVVRVRYPSQNL